MSLAIRITTASVASKVVKGYWNKIRVDFPEVFAARAAMERDIGASCINGTFLDELDPEAGRTQKIIVDDCGILCEAMQLTEVE